MTTFVLAPNAQWTFGGGTDITPHTMLQNGTLAAYRLRANGTMRHVELCPTNSPRRAAAEWVSEQVFAGVPVATIARDLHSSPAVVRRLLMALELTEEIEAGEWQGLTFDAQGEPQWDDSADVEVEEYLDDTAPDSDSDADDAPSADAHGAQCEPTGTTAEELESTLADSLAATA